MRLVVTLLLLSSMAMPLACGKQDQDTSGAAGADTTQAAPDSVVIELAGRDSATVIELLEESHEVEQRFTAMGVFVTAIDSVTNSSDASWVYTVNDTTPQIAADKMVTRDGDRVKWRYRKQ